MMHVQIRSRGLRSLVVVVVAGLLLVAGAATAQAEPRNRTLAAADVPAAPVLLVPADGMTFTHVPRTTTLEWAPVDGATYYELQVDCYLCGPDPLDPYQPVYDTFITETSFTFDWVGDNIGKWRVTAFTDQFVNGPTSEMRTFRYDTTPVNLRVDPSSWDFGRVRDGRTRSKSFTVTNVGPAANVYIGNVSISEDIDFSGGGGSCQGTVLPLGQSCTTTVAFTPTGTGDRTATLYIDSQDGYSTWAKVPLHGIARR